jgi:hypothetical protein
MLPYVRTLRRGRVVAVLAVLGLAAATGLVAVVRQGHGAGQVYTVAQVSAGLARNPRAWSGRTLDVWGRAVLLPCPSTARCWPATAVLVDVLQPRSRIRLTWTRVNPLLGVLFRLPYLGGAALEWVGGVGVYRVRIIRSTLVEPPTNLPNYYPYTSRVVVAYDDQAFLVDGLN